VAAVVLQGVVASAIAWSGQYERILNYVVSVDFVFYGLAAVCVFRFRAGTGPKPSFWIPWHPFTTVFFIAICWLVVGNLVFKQPADSLKGLGILAAGVPVYAWWTRRR
jgi:APA family basic amino acid/polyamine antiporter